MAEPRCVLVVHKPDDWPLEIPGVQLVAASEYLSDPVWLSRRGLRVVNLCRSYRYQSEGYFVSLLAAARRQRPFPELRTVLDMRSRSLLRAADDELDELLQRQLGHLQGQRFELSIYFGRNMTRRYDRLCQRLFAQFPAPLLRARFVRGKRWRMSSLVPIGMREIPAQHLDFVAEAAREQLGRRLGRRRTSRAHRFDLAILRDPEETLAPSCPKAVQRIRRAAEQLGFEVQEIGAADAARLPQFDALFVRETTAVDHHTFRMAQTAESKGLIVVDDPGSILRCTNKVFQAEALPRGGVQVPQTLILQDVDVPRVEAALGFPCVLKLPDSSFSRGVVRCDDAATLERQAADLLESSGLILAQEYVPTDFDWRVGVFGGQLLFACRYLMARGHWQIIKQGRAGRYRYGRVEPVDLSEVPARVSRTALRAAAVIGDGLYGVDLKVLGRRVLVTEVNDNPNLDAGCEDALLGAELYRRILSEFVRRIEARRREP